MTLDPVFVSHRRLCRAIALSWMIGVLSPGADSISQSLPKEHSTWDALLKKYVNAQSLVDYRKWKDAGNPELDSYLKLLAQPWPGGGMTPNEEKAALINAYNALAVHWVLENYPVKSIWRTGHPFTAARQTVNGQQISLDQIEARLRALGDPRIHAALVCASRSCPPLRPEAYVANRIDQQLDDNTRAWLRSPSLNEFLPDSRRARVSPIFKWYAVDFQRAGGSVENFLARYAPASKSDFLRRDFKIEYLPYDWGLNDTASLGAGYSQIQFLWDYFRNKF
jgi:hypothetical protein